MLDVKPRQIDDWLINDNYQKTSDGELPSLFTLYNNFWSDVAVRSKPRVVETSIIANVRMECLIECLSSSIAVTLPDLVEL